LTAKLWFHCHKQSTKFASGRALVWVIAPDAMNWFAAWLQLHLTSAKTKEDVVFTPDSGVKVKNRCAFVRHFFQHKQTVISAKASCSSKDGLL